MKKFILFAAGIIAVVCFLFAGCGDDSPGLVDSTGENGEACEFDEDCQGELCVLQLGTIEFPGGMCSEDCTASPNGQDSCDPKEICLVHNATAVAACYKRCGTDSDCREGYFCQFVTTSVDACLPPF